MTILMFLAGLAGLIAGAELLVRGASKLALSFGISPLVVGLTIVAFGTSSPEMAVSVGAVMDGRTDIAIGNVVGSNIFNVLLILGLSAIITPLVVHIQLIRQEVPIMLGASLLLLVLAFSTSIVIMLFLFSRTMLQRPHSAFSGIFGPDGRLISEPLIDVEGITYADIDLARCIQPKQMHDIIGHYNRFDIFQLHVNRQPQNRVVFHDLPAVAPPSPVDPATD